MNEDKLKDFLKDYVEILRTNIDISEVLPLSSMVDMPGGCVKIYTNDKRLIGIVCPDEGGGPSMPVGPVAMTFSKLFVNLINKYYEEKLI